LIGVIAGEYELEVVREFFELFKTPWELCKRGKRYPVVLSTSSTTRLPQAALTILYGREQRGLSSRSFGETAMPSYSHNATVLRYYGRSFPVYAGCSEFTTDEPAIITREDTGSVVGYRRSVDGYKVTRIGYDLFQEIRILLTIGQPAEYALTPTVDIHISILRNLIIGTGLPLVEIPPVPPGCDLILCLTHDVDFVSIRAHRLDRTVIGFLFRAIVLSLVCFLKGTCTLNKLIRNLLAVVSLPLIHLSLVRDHFNQFVPYRRLEGDLRSTFFLIPRKGVDGKSPDGRNSSGRASHYDVSDISNETRALRATGCEIGLHGIDAWRNETMASEERDKIRFETGSNPIGIRMHWLYFSEETPKVLEQAGFIYDSTLGYNDAVGFRGGTAQVFRPLGLEHLLILPLHVQDTALFLPGRMNMTQNEGIGMIEKIIAEIRRIGGVLTVNWHMRSLGPDRFWDEPYRYLLRIAKGGCVWPATADEVVGWFAMRRSAEFSKVDLQGRKPRVWAEKSLTLPRLILRWYNRPGSDTSYDDEIA